MPRVAEKLIPGALVLLLFSLGLPSVLRGEVENLFGRHRQAGVWHLQAEKFSYDDLHGTYTATGNVRLRSENRFIRADKARLDALTHQAILEGQVRIEQDGDWLKGERAVLDLDEEEGTVKNGRGFLAENHFYFSGAVIEKLGPQTYHLKQAGFTTCDGEEPSWHFKASDLRITVDGYGFAKHTRFYVGPLPVLYSPYLVFPAKRTRQSGFLLPRLARSNLLGTDVDLPFYWAASDSTDATFYAHYMSKRGLMSGAEFRYAASEESKGVFRFDYLRDQGETDDLREEGFRQVEPGFSGEYLDRWWWRSKQDLSLPGHITGKLDLDLVSDRDYLREFETGFSSFQESDRAFENTFGRGLINDESVTTRESTLQLNRSWAAHSVTVDFHYFQNLNRAQDETTLQQLPLLQYLAIRQPLFGSPFFYEADASYVNYWRPEGTRGQRLDVQPRLALPLHWDGYFNLEPSAGLRETLYIIGDFDEPSGSPVEDETFQSRELYDLRVEGSTDLVRVFHTDRGTCTKIKHTLRPEIIYEYIPTLDQSELPSFDSVDRIARKNLVTYSLTNFFVARLDPKPGDIEYVDFARLKLSQSYDLNEAKRKVSTDTQPRQPFSNVLLEVDLTPGRYLGLTYQSEWSPYDGDFKRHEVLGTLWDRRGDSLSVDYREQRDAEGRTTLSEIDGNLQVQLRDGLSFYLRSNYSLEEDENLETEYTLQINRQCWGVSLSFVDEPDERKFMVGFSLYGVGELRPQTVYTMAGPE